MTDYEYAILEGIKRFNDRLDKIIELLRPDHSAEKRKMGKWEKIDDMWDDNVYKCSACYGMFTLIEGTPQDNDMNFCPNCGAKMGEGKEDE